MLIKIFRCVKLKSLLRPNNIGYSTFAEHQNEAEGGELFDIMQLKNKDELLNRINNSNQHEILDKILSPNQADDQKQLIYKESVFNNFSYGILKTLQYDRILSQSIAEYLVKKNYSSLFEHQDPIIPLSNTKVFSSILNLTIGASLDGKECTVGLPIFLNTKKYEENKTRYIIPIVNSKLIPIEYQIVAKKYQEFLDSNNGLNPNQKHACIKKIPNGEMMLIVSLCVKNFNEEMIKTMTDDLNGFFNMELNKECKISSLYCRIESPFDTKSLWRHVNGETFLKHNETLYSPYSYFPMNFESEELSQNKIESLMEQHFNDIDVIIHFNSYLGINVAKKMNKKNVIINNDPKNDLYLQSILKDETTSHFQKLSLVNKAINFEVAKFGENVKIGFIIDNSSKEIAYDKKNLGLIVKVIRSKPQVKKVIYSVNYLNQSFQNCFYDYFCGERKREEIIGEPFFPRHASLIDCLPYTKLFNSIMYLERE